ncbi:MAG: ribonuclease E/G, partial [Bdellovibrionales bacterium]|nr:ribonuclease E/G [Bdellovibrionales bacterium]
AFSKVKDFVKDLQPDLQSRVKLFRGKEGLFKKFDIEAQIQTAGQKKVYLKNGGSIVIEELEAFSVIDVNSGRFMGKGEPQDAILSVNLSAAQVIAQQIRLRHLGGIILIDFIDMESEKHREKLVSFLEKEFSEDRSRPRVFPMVELGLVQITRKRERHPLSTFLLQDCPSCNGQGYIKSYSAVVGEIFQALEELAQKRLFLKKPLFPKVGCHPKIEERIKKEIKSLEFLKKEFRITPEIIPDPLLPEKSFTIKRD